MHLAVLDVNQLDFQNRELNDGQIGLNIFTVQSRQAKYIFNQIAIWVLHMLCCERIWPPI